jgi:hypothetical protein
MQNNVFEAFGTASGSGAVTTVALYTSALGLSRFPPMVRMICLRHPDLVPVDLIDMQQYY